MIPEEDKEQTNLEFVELALKDALCYLQVEKGQERSERARQLAICITELEKVVAYFMYYLAE